MSVFGATGILHAISNSCKKIYSHNFFLLTIIESYTQRNIF